MLYTGFEPSTACLLVVGAVTPVLFNPDSCEPNLVLDNLSILWFKLQKNQFGAKTKLFSYVRVFKMNAIRRIRHSDPKTTPTPISHAFSVSSMLFVVSASESKLCRLKPIAKNALWSCLKKLVSVTFLKPT